MKTWVCAGIALTLAVQADPVSAETAETAETAEIAETAWRAGMKACADLRKDQERLACYDRLAGEDASSVQSPMSPEDVFGMQGSLSRENEPSQAQDRKDIRAVSARVTGLSKSADGSLIIDIDNGQTWRQEEGGELLLAVGDTVVISRAALSSFRLVTPTKRQARVKRMK